MKAFFENDVHWFYFECKVCGWRWFSTCCQCPFCEKVVKFRILSEEQIHEYFIQTMESNIHFVFLN